MIARLLAHPADDLHPTIDFIRADEMLPPQVVIQMDLIPTLLQARNTFDDGLNPDSLRVFRQEDLGAPWVVIEKQQSARRLRRLFPNQPRRHGREPARSLLRRLAVIDRF